MADQKLKGFSGKGSQEQAQILEKSYDFLNDLTLGFQDAVQKTEDPNSAIIYQAVSDIYGESKKKIRELQREFLKRAAQASRETEA